MGLLAELAPAAATLQCAIGEKKPPRYATPHVRHQLSAREFGP